MPYLDSKIDKHYKNCINPVGKRLYIRDYDDKGKQTYVPWGLTCTSCGVVVKQKYQHGLTPKQLRDMELERKLDGSEYAKTVEKVTGRPYGGWEQRLERDQKYKIRDKLERLRRRRLGKDPVYPFEAGLRTRIKNLKRFYQSTSSYWNKAGYDPDADLSEIWDETLVEQFLYVVPRPTISELKKVFDPPESIINVDSQSKYRLMGYVADPDRPGWFKPDGKAYGKLLKSEAHKRMELMQQIIKSREVK